MALLLVPSATLTRPIPDEIFAAWLDAGGQARRALLEPLRGRLARAPAPPSSFMRSIEPLRWLIDRGRKQGLRLDRDGFLAPSFAVPANVRFGFTTEEFHDGDRAVLEIDQLLMLAHAIGAVEAKSLRVVTTARGRCYLSDRLALWQTAASFLCALPPEDGFIARMWEMTLAWLLQPDLDTRPLSEAATESLGPDDPQPGDPDFEVTMSVAVNSLYTLCRGLDMFTEPPKNRPTLNEMGRATARAALRAACIVNGERLP